MKSEISRRSVAELVARYATIGIAQDKALWVDNAAGFNRHVDEMLAIEAELQSRSGDDGRALLSLFDHPALQVQLNAARATLALEPVAARAKVEEISRKDWAPQGGHAGLMLLGLDEGSFRPT